MKLRLLSALTVMCSAAAAFPAGAATLSGNYVASGATTGSGPYVLTSTDSTYSELDLVFSTLVNFGNLSSLSVDYISQLGGIGQGAPRIYLITDANHDSIADGYIQIQFGPAGSFANPALGAGNTGNLLSLTDLGRYDLTGIGQSAYTDRATALSFASTFGILEADLVIDSFGGNNRIFTINSINVATSGAVPEPSTWAMMLAGFGMIGSALRRRRRASLKLA